MLGFVVVDDGIVADVGDRFVVFVDGRILGVDIGQIGAVVLVDIAVPRVIVDGNVIGLVDGACGGGYIDVYTVALGFIRIFTPASIRYGKIARIAFKITFREIRRNKYVL